MVMCVGHDGGELVVKIVAEKDSYVQCSERSRSSQGGLTGGFVFLKIANPVYQPPIQIWSRSAVRGGDWTSDSS